MWRARRLAGLRRPRGVPHRGTAYGPSQAVWGRAGLVRCLVVACSALFMSCTGHAEWLGSGAVGAQAAGQSDLCCYLCAPWKHVRNTGATCTMPLRKGTWHAMAKHHPQPGPGCQAPSTFGTWLPLVCDCRLLSSPEPGPLPPSHNTSDVPLPRPSDSAQVFAPLAWQLLNDTRRWACATDAVSCFRGALQEARAAGRHVFVSAEDLCLVKDDRCVHMGLRGMPFVAGARRRAGAVARGSAESG